MFAEMFSVEKIQIIKSLYHKSIRTYYLKIENQKLRSVVLKKIKGNSGFSCSFLK